MWRWTWVCLLAAACEPVPDRVGPITTFRDVGVRVVVDDPAQADAWFVRIATPEQDLLFEGAITSFLDRPIPLVIPVDARSLEVTVEPVAGGVERVQVVAVDAEGHATIDIGGAP